VLENKRQIPNHAKTFSVCDYFQLIDHQLTQSTEDRFRELQCLVGVKQWAIAFRRFLK
jgi:hypothetical protein